MAQANFPVFEYYTTQVSNSMNNGMCNLLRRNSILNFMIVSSMGRQPLNHSVILENIPKCKVNIFVSMV